MKLLIAVIGSLLCMAYAVPVPRPAESIDLINIPLSGDKELDILTFADQDGTINERNKRTIGMLRELFPQLSKVRAVEDEYLLEPNSAGSDAILETIRVARETNNLNNNQNNKINTDQQAEASEKAADQQVAPAENTSLDELTLDSLEDDENRDKRFLNFGGSSGNGQASAGGSGGGSGNFLFDIIRRTADRVARGAGSAFRVVAGTESIDSAIKNFNSDTGLEPNSDDQLKVDSSEARSARSGDLSLLVSGSSGSEQTDESQNGETEVGKGDGYTEGIPGPVTRLFVLANRGLSNLVQDLILRIAQTSERVVNFKARLITSLI